MPQNDIATKLSAAKGVLSRASSAFPSSMAPKAPASKPASAAPAPKPAAPSLGKELSEKASNVSAYAATAPKMHNGGPVLADGVYSMKKGEHVLTEAEAKKARKHALMAAGMKSLAKATPKAADKKKK